MYIAPEVQSRKRGPRNHSKADMYSLGVRLFRLSCLNCTHVHLLQIVFFEMNYSFTTGAGRIAVLEDIRKPAIFFPSDWDAHRTRQRESKLNVLKIYVDAFLLKACTIAVITLLLQHEPDKRPTALELSQSPLLPSRLEDEYFKGALRMMGWFHSLVFFF